MGISAAMGFLVPVIFEVLFAIIDFENYRLDVTNLFVDLRTYLWPTSIVMIGFASLPNWSLTFLLIRLGLALLNIPIYVALGALCWLVAKAAQRLSSRHRS
jgi:hypothetical protein